MTTPDQRLHKAGGQAVAGLDPVIPTNKNRGQLHIAVALFFSSGSLVAGLWPFYEQLDRTKGVKT